VHVWQAERFEPNRCGYLIHGVSISRRKNRASRRGEDGEGKRKRKWGGSEVFTSVASLGMHSFRSVYECQGDSGIKLAGEGGGDAGGVPNQRTMSYGT